MADELYSIRKSTLTATAQALRDALETSTEYAPEAFPAAIRAVTSGPEITTTPAFSYGDSHGMNLWWDRLLNDGGLALDRSAVYNRAAGITRIFAVRWYYYDGNITRESLLILPAGGVGGVYTPATPLCWCVGADAAGNGRFLPRADDTITVEDETLTVRLYDCGGARTLEMTVWGVEDAAGTYDGKSDVTDAAGNSAGGVWSVQVLAFAPAASEFSVKLTSDLAQKLYLTSDTAGGLTIDWGDGSAPETPEGTTVQAAHSYAAAGNYTIRVTPADGVTWTPGCVSGDDKYNVMGLIYTTSTSKAKTNATLTKAILRGGLTAVGDYAFHNCTSFASVGLPERTTEIGRCAFNGCTTLEMEALPAGLTSIGIAAFQSCAKLALTELPAGITSLGRSAFSGTKAALTELPAGLTAIESNTFFNCAKLALTALPAGITGIGDSAFYGCAKLALTALPAELESIGTGAFHGCTGLTKLWIRYGCAAITAANATSSPFAGCGSGLTLYTEAAEKPEGWSEYWNYLDGETQAAVVWGQTTRP